VSLFALAHLKRRRTIAFMALLAIGAGIFGNALFLQAGPHPAPFFFTRAFEHAPPGQSDELVRAIQDALLQLGYYSGPLDGLAGPRTRLAIKTFRERSGGEGTEEASLELLSEIRSSRRPDLSPVETSVAASGEQSLRAARTAPEAVAPLHDPPEPDGLVAAVQEALARSAYGPLTVDGVAGEETRQAIMRFQKDHNLHATGEVSDALVVELRAAGALGGG
jgi:peptidoglycan hydrolase-like protein with peptidoglycan-binding domain